ncbi:unnamed protein product, partial [Scytosiphon promiscuus]
MPFECLTLRARASMAMAMVSSTAFGEAVREALVRSPSLELRANAFGMLAGLSRIDHETALRAICYEMGHLSVSLTTIWFLECAQLLVSLVPYCRNEPDGAKCRELYELLSLFLSKGNVDACSLCAALPALYPPQPTAGAPDRPLAATTPANNGNNGTSGSTGTHAALRFYSMDGPLPGPPSLEERGATSTAVASLSKAVAADGAPGLARVVPLLVWLMRLIVEPRVTPADGHLTGLLGLARIIVGWLGPRGKEAVGLWGLEGIVVAAAAPPGEGDNGRRFDPGSGRGAGLLHHVYHECLFDIATHDNHGPLAPPKCRTEGCRANAFGLLTDLATGCRANVAVLINLLLRHHSSSSPCQRPSPAAEPTNRPPGSSSAPDGDGDGGSAGGNGGSGMGVERVSWSYAPRQADKAECGYVGLQNLGATCYMNSLLQQLYMVPALRFGVLSCDPFFRSREQVEKGEEVVPREENLLYQLQDVDEFLLVFLDRLETQLSALPQKRLLQHVFGGQLCNQLIGAEAVCPHVSERQEDFFVLGLDVKGKRSITESLQLYVEGEVLAGDNKFLCAKCNEKRDTLKRTCIARLPNVLFLHLKRFEFDMMEMKKVKVNDKCEFPMELNMRPYTKEGLARQQKERQKEEGKQGGGELPGGTGGSNGNGNGHDRMSGTSEKEGGEEEEEEEQEVYPDAYYEYKLAGVLVHMGTADSGHYYSYIKKRDMQGGGDDPASWFCFNDASVTAFDPASLGMTCHGGYTISATGRGQTPKQFSAYMLIYEREFILPNPAPPPAPSAPDDDVPSSASAATVVDRPAASAGVTVGSPAAPLSQAVADTDAAAAAADSAARIGVGGAPPSDPSNGRSGDGRGDGGGGGDHGGTQAMLDVTSEEIDPKKRTAVEGGEEDAGSGRG